MSLRLTALLAVVLLVSAQHSAVAAGTAEEEARRHFELGQRHFTLAEFDGAVEEYKRAYEISPVPGLLFNIAQAYRAKKDNGQALYFYQTYLREEPAASERTYVDQRIEELKASEEARKQVEAAAAGGPQADEASRRRLRLAGVIVGGGGLAFAGASVIMGVRAASATSDVDDRGPLGRDEIAHLHDGQKYATASWILGAIGVGAMATGGLLYYLGTREHPVSLSATPTAGGAALGIVSSF